MKSWKCYAIGVLASWAILIPNLSAATVNVFAAASLTDALKEIAIAYQTQSGDRIVYNFAASSTLARQIAEGAPADIFFSADEARMDQLEEKKLIIQETRQSRLSNSLVIVVASDSGADVHHPEDLATARVKRIALAETRSVPAGIYAKQYLLKQNLWSSIEHKVVPTENVRAALAAVEAGNVQAGIVYKTDAAISKNVKVAYEVPIAQGPPISYPIAILKDAREPDAAKRFLRHLESEPSTRVFQKFGFLIRPY